MAYIWENYTYENTYISGKKICPYIEVMNNEKTFVEVNPLLRFSELFELLHDDEIIQYVENIESLENVVFHYLAQLDRGKGLNNKQRLIEKIRKEIMDGYFGKSIKDIWTELKKEDQEMTVYLLSQKMILEKETIFIEAMNKLFPLSSVCYEKDSKVYYVYIWVEDSVYNKKKFDLIKAVFWNKCLEIKVVWKKHYGIIGIPETMNVDEIQII